MKNIKYIVAGVILITIILLSVRGCINSKGSELTGENKILKEQVEGLKGELLNVDNNRIKERDSINKEFILKQEQITNLEKRDRENQGKIANLKEKNRFNKDRIAKLTFRQSAQEFNIIYQTKDAVATDKGVELQNDLSNRVLQSVDDANSCQDIVAIKDEQIADKDLVIKNKDGQIKDKSILLVTAENQIESQKLLQMAQDKYSFGLEKENKNLKKGKWWDKWVIKPGLFAVGGFLGYKLAK